MQKFWKHIKNGNVYQFLHHANVDCENEEKWPHLVVYKETFCDEWIYARPYKEFLEKFEPVDFGD